MSKTPEDRWWDTFNAALTGFASAFDSEGTWTGDCEASANAARAIADQSHPAFAAKRDREAAE